MNRRFLLWGLLLLAIPLAIWGIAEISDGRPNPILVTMAPQGGAGPPAPAPAVPAAMAGVPFVEVEVARARPIRPAHPPPDRGQVRAPGGSAYRATVQGCYSSVYFAARPRALRTGYLRAALRSFRRVAA